MFKIVRGLLIGTGLVIGGQWLFQTPTPTIDARRTAMNLGMTKPRVTCTEVRQSLGAFCVATERQSEYTTISFYLWCNGGSCTVLPEEGGNDEFKSE